MKYSKDFLKIDRLQNYYKLNIFQILFKKFNVLSAGSIEYTATPLQRYYLPTPPLGQDMTQGQFLSGV